jgi:hypothetical protein
MRSVLKHELEDNLNCTKLNTDTIYFGSKKCKNVKSPNTKEGLPITDNIRRYPTLTIFTQNAFKFASDYGATPSLISRR